METGDNAAPHSKRGFHGPLFFLCHLIPQLYKNSSTSSVEAGQHRQISQCLRSDPKSDKLTLF